MTVLDTNVVAVVLPTIARDLGASFAEVEWVVSTYVLCFAALLLPAGSIADRFGRRKVFLGGIGLFALASLLCGAAPSAPALYLARGAQGVGAAFLLAPALAIIGHAFHDEAERARAWAIWGGIMGLTMVLAPIIGGVIAYGLGWRWAFYVNVPVCALLGTAVLPLIQELRDSEARSLDPAGIILFAASMFGLTWGLIHGQAQGWLSTSALAGFAGGFAAFIGFLAAETNQARPMLDLALFRLPRFIGAVLAMFAYAASAQVMAQLLPLYLQNGLGLPPLDAGLAMLPFAIAMLILPQIGQWLGRYLASHQILALGLSVVCLGNLVTAWGAAGSLVAAPHSRHDYPRQRWRPPEWRHSEGDHGCGAPRASRHGLRHQHDVAIQRHPFGLCGAEHHHGDRRASRSDDKYLRVYCEPLRGRYGVRQARRRRRCAEGRRADVPSLADDRQRDCSSRLCHGLRGRAAYRRRRRRSLRDRGRNPNAAGEGPVIIADCVRRRRKGTLREQTDRQRGLGPSSAARFRRNTDPRCRCRRY